MTTRFDALFEIGRYEDALRVAGEARAADPDDYEAACDLARAYVALERYDDGLRAAADAAALQPDDEDAHRIGSICLRALGRHREAVAAAEEAVRLGDDLVEPWKVLFHAYDEAGRPDDALRVAHHMVTEFPDDARSHSVMGWLAVNRHQWQLAERAFRTALSIEPGDSAALHNLGVVLQAQGRGKEAVELLGAAVKADPGDEFSQQVLGGFAARHAVRGAVVAVVLVLIVARLLTRNGSNDVDAPEAQLAGSITIAALVVGYMAYRLVAAVRLAGLPGPAGTAASAVFRVRDKVASRVLAFFGVAQTVAAADFGEWPAAALMAVVTVLPLVWAFDGRWGLPRLGESLDRLLRATGRDRSGRLPE